MDERAEKQGRVGELAVGRRRGRHRGRRMGHDISHPWAGQFDDTGFLGEPAREVGAAGPADEPVVGAAGPFRQRRGEPFEPRAIDLRFHVPPRIDHHQSLPRRIMQHDLDEFHLRIGGGTGGRQFQEVPGDAVAKQGQAAHGRRVGAVGEQPRFDPHHAPRVAVGPRGSAPDQDPCQQSAGMGREATATNHERTGRQERTNHGRWSPQDGRGG